MKKDDKMLRRGRTKIRKTKKSRTPCFLQKARRQH